MDCVKTFDREGAFVSPRPGDTKVVYMLEHGASTRHTLVTHGVRSCSTLVWYVFELAVFGLAHIAAGVSDVDADAFGDLGVAVADVVARQVEPALQTAASYGRPFIIHIGHGYSTADNMQAGLLTWLAAYAADPAHNATLHVSETFRAFSRDQIPWGSTRVSITATGGHLLVEEKVILMPSPVFEPPAGESATLPGYNGPALEFPGNDGQIWKLVDRMTLNKYFVSTAV